MASISLQGIKKSFDQFPVITDADIAVDDGCLLYTSDAADEL